MNNKIVLYTLTLGILTSNSLPSHAVGSATQIAALKEITQAANDICGTVPIIGESGQYELSGSAKAQLTGIAAKVVELGAQIEGKDRKETFSNVPQQELAKTLLDTQHCKSEALRLLSDKMLGQITEEKPAEPQTKPSEVTPETQKKNTK